MWIVVWLSIALYVLARQVKDVDVMNLPPFARAVLEKVHLVLKHFDFVVGVVGLATLVYLSGSMDALKSGAVRRSWKRFWFTERYL